LRSFFFAFDDSDGFAGDGFAGDGFAGNGLADLSTTGIPVSAVIEAA
jgi:hypothetical protein